MSHYCYLIVNDKSHTYIGSTNDPDRRLKQHNGLLSGGAKATKKSTTWKYKCLIACVNKQAAESIEWYWKHKKNSKDKWVSTTGLDERLKHVDLLKDNYGNKIENFNIYF